MSSAHGFLPYGRHIVDDDDIAAVVDVLKGDWLTTGPTVEAYEHAFAEAVGAHPRPSHAPAGRQVFTLPPPPWTLGLVIR